MEIIVRELNGRHSKERLAEVTVDHFGNKLEFGVHTIQDRKELAEHLKGVIEDLLWELPSDHTTKETK